MEKEKPNIAPQYREILTLSDTLQHNHHALWGHGTPSFNTADSFFQKGIQQRKSSPYLDSTAMPINRENIDVIDNWPHRPHSPDVNVVLLAVPNPDKDAGVTPRDILEHIMQHNLESDAVVFPSEDIAGMYDAQRKILIPNPFFTIDTESQNKKIRAIKEIQKTDRDRVSNMQLKRPGGRGALSRMAMGQTVAPPILQTDPSKFDDVDIW